MKEGKGAKIKLEKGDDMKWEKKEKRDNNTLDKKRVKGPKRRGNSRNWCKLPLPNQTDSRKKISRNLVSGGDPPSPICISAQVSAKLSANGVEAFLQETGRFTYRENKII